MIYTHHLKVLRTISFNGEEVVMERPKVLGLFWPSTYQFLMTIKDMADPFEENKVFTVNLKDSRPPLFANYGVFYNTIAGENDWYFL